MGKKAKIQNLLRGDCSLKMCKSESLDQLQIKYPLIKKLQSLDEVFWINPSLEKFQSAAEKASISIKDILLAEERLKRFAPYIASVFPETKEMAGLIESPLVEISSMKNEMEKNYELSLPGKLMLKCDNNLPVSGSIKARGGIYEILKHAEDLALEHQLLSKHDDYTKLANERFRDFFQNYSISVGSTGNLGLSIGIISAKLGFKVTVHMSADAKQWKKDLLRRKHVTVTEYDQDYSKAVAEGRIQAQADPRCYFVDDENSRDLFMGYAVAAIRLKKQLENQSIYIDQNHPLFVYLPCGVGGGPGGVAYGLKLLFKDHVHCFFAEPTHSPCMLLGLATGLHDQISVQDIGLDNTTEADGLAVGRPSGFVGNTIEPFLSGSFTIKDENLYKLLAALVDTEEVYLEPSALAGMIGPVKLLQEGKAYLQEHQLLDKMVNGTHIIWGTGGSMVPKNIMMEYYQKGTILKNAGK
jgi:D-serine dehydratase